MGPFVAAVEAAESCSVLLAELDGWASRVGDPYTDLVNKTNKMSFSWQDPEQMSVRVVGEARRLNEIQRALAERLVRKLESEQGCFASGRGEAVIESFYEVGPLPNFTYFD